MHSPETKAVLCKMAQLEVELFPLTAPDAAPGTPLHALRSDGPPP